MKQIELLLTQSVDNLGIVGDVVKVRPGFARNFLTPRGMATDPTPGNIKRLAARRAEVEKEMKAQRGALEAALEKLKGHEVTIQRSANEQGVLFGGVSQHDIAEVLRGEGHHIEDRMVRIGETIKRLDSYNIPIVLASDLRGDIKLWVVSDKPAGELEAEGAGAAEAETEIEEPQTEKAEKPEKPAKKSRKQREDEAAEHGKEGKEPKAAKEGKGGKGSKAEDDEAKPRKKGKKTEAE